MAKVKDIEKAKKIIEHYVGAGILTHEELSQWAEIFTETLQRIGFTVDNYLTAHPLEKEVVWQAFRKRLSEHRGGRDEH